MKFTFETPHPEEVISDRWEPTIQDTGAGMYVTRDVVFDSDTDLTSLALFAPSGSTMQVVSGLQQMPPSWVRTIAKAPGTLFQWNTPVISDPGGTSEGTATVEYISYEVVDNGTLSGAFSPTGTTTVGAVVDPSNSDWTKVDQHACGFSAGTWAVAVRLTWTGSGTNGGTVYFREPRLSVVICGDNGWEFC